jgi:hypothetical protein
MGMSEGPHIEVWPSGIMDFLHVYNPPTIEKISIRNTGTSDLAILSLRLDNGKYYSMLGSPALPFTIAAGKKEQFPIEFNAKKVGQHRSLNSYKR